MRRFTKSESRKINSLIISERNSEIDQWNIIDNLWSERRIGSQYSTETLRANSVFLSWKVLNKKCLFCKKELSSANYSSKRKFCSPKCNEDYDRKIRTKNDTEYANRRRLIKTKSVAKYVSSGKAKEQKRKYYANNDQARIARSIRNRIRSIIIGSGGEKSDSSFGLVGCSRDELMTHLQNQFTRGMAFNNYGKWHVDHIVPCCKFDQSNPEDQKRCNHFTNLRPLWAWDNISKGGNILPNCQPKLAF